MKIVINALQYKQNSSGIGVMIRELFQPFVKLTKQQVHVILPKDGPEFSTGETVQCVRIPYDHHQGLKRIFFQTFQLGHQYGKDAVMLVTDSKTPLFLPKSCKLMPLVTDLAMYRMPEVYQFSRTTLWRLQYWYIRRRADRFLAISEFTKRELTEVFRIPEDKICVVPCACPLGFSKPDNETVKVLRSRMLLPERFILFVGNNNPRKNLSRIMQAFDLVKEAGLPHHLVIAGEQGWKFSKNEALAGTRHCETIHFVGYVSDEDMPALYAASDLFLFPSLYEGFGIPILEAQTCGTPVVASNVTAMPEVGGDAAVYADPYDPADICKAMLKVLQNRELAQAMVERGYENVQRYSWETSAEKLNRIVEEAANK